MLLAFGILMTLIGGAFIVAIILYVSNSDTEPALHFTYRNASGQTSDRIVRDWHQNGDYIIGFCCEANAERTFRLDRVIAWQMGSERHVLLPEKESGAG
ncbi:WYL domain-containing protein [Phenylobacterium sp.]|uniref:WYL domain-containing protein n=1 Tax=Phenylobacterium sp. TaxID=1871053 RepID=UPI00301BD2AA